MMIDSTNIAFMVDTINNESCIQNHEVLKDFKFVAEQSSHFEGPKEREVTFISASWNFVILFVVMILMVMNKFLFRNRSDDRTLRESHSFINMTSFFVVTSFVLMISLFVQKAILVYGGNHILHSSFDFFVNVLFSVTTIFILNYLLTSCYAWLFKTENLIFLHVSTHITAMSSCNFVLIPAVMLLLLYPYKAFVMITSVILIAFFFVRLAKLLTETRMLLKLNFVNIFLYLCTIEILPVLVIFKMLINVM